MCIYLLDLFILGSPTPQLLFTDWGCIVRLCILFPKALYTLWITSSFRHGLDQSTMVQIPNLWWKNIDRRAKQLHPLYFARWITPFWGNGEHPNLGDLQVVFSFNNGIGCGDRCGTVLFWELLGSQNQLTKASHWRPESERSQKSYLPKERSVGWHLYVLKWSWFLQLHGSRFSLDLFLNLLFFLLNLPAKINTAFTNLWHRKIHMIHSWCGTQQQSCDVLSLFSPIAIMWSIPMAQKATVENVPCNSHPSHPPRNQVLGTQIHCVFFKVLVHRYH